MSEPAFAFLMVAGGLVALFVIREIVARIMYWRWIKRGAKIEELIDR